MRPAYALNDIYDGIRIRTNADLLMQAVRGMKYIGIVQKKELIVLLHISEDTLEEFYLELLNKNVKLPFMVF